ncbi:MAG TPA: response regulator transcription factor [Thermoanaerobaculia bacterium]|nr:response regulator transcription factor [Thermoanaerobaculia bacterium]
MIKVLIADDHVIFREGLKRILETALGIEVVAEAASGEEALQRAWDSSPNVVLLDVSMPGRGGIETVQEFKRRDSKIKILMLTAHPEDHFAVRCLREGADGYVTKNAAPEQLVAALRKIANGGKYVSPSLAERLAFNLDASFERPEHERLSARELQVLLLISAGMTASAIAVDLHLSVKTVSTYRARILEKMHMKTNAEIMHYAIELGLGR